LRHFKKKIRRLFGFCRVIVFYATFNNIAAILWQSVYWWRKSEYSEKTTNLSQVTDKLYHIHLAWTGFELTTLVVIDTDCTGLDSVHRLWCLMTLSTILMLNCGCLIGVLGEKHIKLYKVHRAMIGNWT
jgi:hypothetical protein